jgi:hypothetical protein
VIICFANWGYRLTFVSIQSIIQEYLRYSKQNSIFRNKRPGRDWYNGFLKPWDYIFSSRKADYIASARAMSCTDEIIEKYFRNCQIVFNEQKIDSSKGSFVWNCDETGFNGDRGKISILYRKGTR